jgi:hypothetical protein
MRKIDFLYKVIFLLFFFNSKLNLVSSLFIILWNTKLNSDKFSLILDYLLQLFIPFFKLYFDVLINWNTNNASIFLSLQLLLTGLCIMSLSRRRNRYSYLVSWSDLRDLKTVPLTPSSLFSLQQLKTSFLSSIALTYQMTTVTWVDCRLSENVNTHRRRERALVTWSWSKHKVIELMMGFALSSMLQLVDRCLF